MVKKQYIKINIKIIIDCIEAEVIDIKAIRKMLNAFVCD